MPLLGLADPGDIRSSGSVGPSSASFPYLAPMSGPSTPLAQVTPSLAAARDASVVCDVSGLALVSVQGPDAAAFLHGQLSSDVAGLAAEACQYSSFNSPTGRMLANFVLWRGGAEPGSGFYLLLPADIAPAVRKRLAMFVLRSKVTIDDVSDRWRRLGVGGPSAGQAIHAAFGIAPSEFGVAQAGAVTVVAVPGSRYYVLAPEGDASRVATALGVGASGFAPFEAWQWLTIHAGVPVITAATQDKFVAQSANWDVLGGVNFKKGCYTGQEIIARMQYLGRLKERLFAFRGPATSVAPGDRLYSPAFDLQACGTVVNAARSPDNDVHLLAVVQLAAVASGEVRLGTPEGPHLTRLALPYSVPAPVEPPARATRP